MKKSRVRVAMGMSGGVDSSVAASILVTRGYDVTGVFMESWNGPGCRTDEDRRDALRVAVKLDIPFEVLDFKKEYRARVVSYFYDTYRQGLTPNPDVMCNKEIKFGLFYQWAMERGYEAVATGHYARINDDDGVLRLQRGKDEKKDQSYFLYQIDQDQLKHIIFPIGEMQKSEVRRMAKELDLHVKDKPDSMGICFIGDVNVHDLLLGELGENLGNVKYQGKVVGRHKGLWFHTIGQRGGFELNKDSLRDLEIDPSSMRALYAIEKDRSSNTLIVGSRKDAYTDKIVVSDMNWMSGELSKKVDDLYVRVRNLGDLIVCTLEEKENKVLLRTVEKIFGVAEGQSAVIYQKNGKSGDEYVLGGGIISYSR